MSDAAGPIPPAARRLPSGDRLVICRDADEMAERAAGYLAVTIGTATADRPLLAAVAGGATPMPTYARLARSDLPWSRLHIVLTDERLVPPDDPRSNFHNIREACSPTPARLLPMVPPGALEAGHVGEALALDYAALLGRLTPRRRGSLPVLDLAVCGLGADGHVASLFPGAAGTKDGEAVVLAVPAPSPGAPDATGLSRLTLSLPVLEAADRLVFLVSGPEKSEALREALEGRGAGPAARLSRLGRATWFVDPPAAARLTPD